jgi:hypothetical protein
MSTTSPKLKASYYEPGRNDPCVCGSALKFKKCCLGKYSRKSHEHLRDSFNAGNFEDALIQARNFFTWYALSHKAHTIHLLEVSPEDGENLLYVDIEALAEIVTDLHLCYYRLGRNNEFPDVTHHIRNVVDDQRWHDKISYFQGLWHLVDKHNEAAAFAELRAVDIETCHDPDVLSLYLQVCPSRHTLTETVEIIDRIISNTQKECVRLQYRILKATKYLLVCQHDESNRIFEEAIYKFASLPEDKKSSHGKFLYAHALSIFATLDGQRDLLEQGHATVEDLIHTAINNNLRVPSSKGFSMRIWATTHRQISS